MEAALDGTSFGVDDAGAASVSSEAAARRICCCLDDDLFASRGRARKKKKRRSVRKKVERDIKKKRKERRENLEKEIRAHLFVAEEEWEVRRRAVHVDDANANDDAMFVFFSCCFFLCCVVSTRARPTSFLMRFRLPSRRKKCQNNLGSQKCSQKKKTKPLVGSLHFLRHVAAAAVVVV